MLKIPSKGIRDNDIKNLVEANELFNISVIQETMFASQFRLFIDKGSQRYELYTQRGQPKKFASVNSVYKYCQNMGINQFLVNVERNKDGV